MRSPSSTYLLVSGLAATAVTAQSVFTYGPASNYRKAPAVTASPTGDVLRITPTDVSAGIPAEGLDFFLGPDLQASLKETLDGVCADETPSKECLDKLSVALDLDGQYTIEKRIIGGGLLLGAAGAAIVALGIKLFSAPQPELQHFHLESSDVAQIQTMTESTAVVATATGSDHITVTVNPTTTSSVEPATITTLSADASGHHQGDVLIALPTQQADLLDQLMRQVGAPKSCKSETQSKTKRQSGNGPNLAAISDIAQFVLPMAAPGHLLQGLGLQALDHLPQLKAAVDQASLETVQAAAAALDQFKDVAVGLRDLIAEAVWVAAYDICVYEQIEQSTLVLEDQLITDDPAEDDDDDEDPENCPTDALDRPICDDSQCAGEAGICQAGDKEGCKCLGSTPYYVHFGDRQFMDTSYQVFVQMFELNDGTSAPTPNYINGGELTCGDRTDIGNEVNFFSLDAMTSAAERFCELRVEDQIKWAPVLPEDYDPATTYVKELYPGNGDNKVLASMTWVVGNMSCPTLDMTAPDAKQMCKERFGAIIHNCDTSNPENIELWKQGGYYDKDCVHWYIGKQVIYD